MFQSSPRSVASPPRSRGLTPQWASESVCLYRKPLADSSGWMRGLTCRSAPAAPLGGLWATIPGGASPWAIARASGGALCPAQRHRPGRPRGVLRMRVALRQRRRKSCQLPCQFSGPCLSSRKFQSHRGVRAPRRGYSFLLTAPFDWYTRCRWCCKAAAKWGGEWPLMKNTLVPKLPFR
jgi:hypothetical protein